MLIRGSVFIHSCPAALKHHVEWSLQSILGQGISLSWRTQPMQAGTYRAEISWREKTSKASEIATALRSWHYLRFEVHELDKNGGELFRCTPELGIHRASLDAAGNIQISESQIAKALSHFDDLELRENLELALGKPWDATLEPFRGVDLQEIARLRAI